MFCHFCSDSAVLLLVMGKKNNLGKAIIKDRFKAGHKKSGASFVSDSTTIHMCYLDRRLATAWIHCAGSATYQVTDPEPEP